MLVRSQFFTLRMAEKDLSHVADATGIVIATCINLYRFG